MEALIVDMEKGRTRGDGMEEEQAKDAKAEKTEELGQQQQHNKISLATTSITPRQQQQQVYRKDSSSTQEKRLYERQSSSGSAVSSTNNSSMPGLHHSLLYKRPEIITRSLKPVVPKGELIRLKPRLVTKPENNKTKPPKFVPYEPYPGAVNPLEPKVTEKMKQKINKNNLDIGILVDQMSTIRTQELKDNTSKVDVKSEADLQELKKMREEIEKLRQERDHYEGQFKFQTQVNTELKSLLLASVGEDLQTHVNVLTEDKLQLARALLDTAKNLTTHTEQIEFLAGQCEVWRSKFLGSSIIIEELARCKADLTQKNQLLTESTKRLLEGFHQLRDMQLEILKNLKFVAKIRYLNLPAADVVSLSAENLNILQQMVLHAGLGLPDTNLNISCASKNTLSEAEKFAMQSLEFISQPLIATDEAIRGIFSQAQRPYSVGVATTNSETNINSQSATQSQEKD